MLRLPPTEDNNPPVETVEVVEVAAEVDNRIQVAAIHAPTTRTATNASAWRCRPTRTANPEVVVRNLRPVVSNHPRGANHHRKRTRA